MGAFNDFNQKIIAEFRENSGKVGGPFAGVPVLLLHSTGAKSGKERLNPLCYSKDGDRFVIIASKGGAPTSPDWYYNLVANKDATIEVGTETIPVQASVAPAGDRDRLYAAQVAIMPQFDQ